MNRPREASILRTSRHEMRQDREHQADDFHANARQDERDPRRIRGQQRKRAHDESPARQQENETDESHAPPRGRAAIGRAAIIARLKYHSCARRREHKEFALAPTSSMTVLAVETNPLS